MFVKVIVVFCLCGSRFSDSHIIIFRLTLNKDSHFVRLCVFSVGACFSIDLSGISIVVQLLMSLLANMPVLSLSLL